MTLSVLVLCPNPRMCTEGENQTDLLKKKSYSTLHERRELLAVAMAQLCASAPSPATRETVR